MKTLSGGRIRIAAQALRTAAGLYELSCFILRKRETFGKPINHHQAIQFKLADMYVDIENARNLVYKAAWHKDQNMDYNLSGAVAKLHASEVAMRTTVEAVQIHSGYGYELKNTMIQRLMRDAKITQIYGGTSREFKEL